MFHWYAINTYSEHENKVKANLEHRIDSKTHGQDRSKSGSDARLQRLQAA